MTLENISRMRSPKRIEEKLHGYAGKTSKLFYEICEGDILKKADLKTLKDYRQILEEIKQESKKMIDKYLKLKNIKVLPLNTVIAEDYSYVCMQKINLIKIIEDKIENYNKTNLR
ncbi:MAG: hypothetical protein WCX73_04490 [Candidatus Pacearchaeota archaeon]|jgi:uncharacterized protein (DUF488 family)